VNPDAPNLPMAIMKQTPTSLLKDHANSQASSDRSSTCLLISAASALGFPSVGVSDAASTLPYGRSPTTPARMRRALGPTSVTGNKFRSPKLSKDDCEI
jgi:hypothetical protein